MKKKVLRRVCWASATGECYGKLSREHVISKSILELFRAKTVSFATTSIGINSFTIRFLCEKHNSDLSVFDKEAANLFSCLLRFGKRNATKEELGIPSRVTIDGHKIERWLAKTYFNLLIYREDTRQHELESPINPVSYLIRSCFGGEAIESPQGVYVSPHCVQTEKGEKPIQFNCFEAVGSILKAKEGYKRYDLRYQYYLDILIYGLSFRFVFNVSGMTNKDANYFTRETTLKEKWFDDAVYRPESPIGIRGVDGYSGIIDFTWE